MKPDFYVEWLAQATTIKVQLNAVRVREERRMSILVDVRVPHYKTENYVILTEMRMLF